MPYNYETEKPKLFTPEIAPKVLQLKDRAFKLCEEAGACSFLALTKKCDIADSWQLLAAVDYLVELEYLRKLPNDGRAQDQIYVWSRV